MAGMSAANAAPITATDSLSQALKANIIPNQEYLLQVSCFYYILICLKNLRFFFNPVLTALTGICARFGCRSFTSSSSRVVR